jgi:hypothetical protein
MLVTVAVLVVVLPESELEPATLADLNPGENPEVFGLETEIVMMEGTITVRGIENPELASLTARVPMIVVPAAPTGPAPSDVSRYESPELFGIAARGLTIGPLLSTISPYENPELFGAAAHSLARPTVSQMSPYDNPELFGPEVGVTLVLEFPTQDPHESPEVLRMAVPGLIPLWLVAP